jgi:hypothetical protein
MEYCLPVRELDGNGGQLNCIMIFQLIDRIHFVRLWLHVPNIKEHLPIRDVIMLLISNSVLLGLDVPNVK